MGSQVKTKCHSLVLMSAEKVSRYSCINSKAKIIYLAGGYKPDVVPGTIVASEEDAEVGVKIKITFSAGLAFSSTRSLLRAFSKMPLLAQFTDENGITLLAGSPSYPLTMKLAKADGVINCTLEGAMPHDIPKLA